MALPLDPGGLLEAAAGGDRRALARLISIVEDGGPGWLDVLRLAGRQRSDSHRVGVTGAPGAGKSTITDRLLTLARGEGGQVGVLAVDPTSPFSGGALLGDRVRMQDHALDAGVYIRSMASRGHLGGLSAAAPRALAVMEAAGFPLLLVETVGVGQDEVEIVDAADTTIVVLTPGWGDGIQAAKAGILEIGDVFVVNKADRPGVDDTVADIRAMLSFDESRPWLPPIVATVAETGDGIDALWEAIGGHYAHLQETGQFERGRRSRRRGELETALATVFRRRAAAVLDGTEGGSVADRVASGDLDPWNAAEQLLADGACGEE
jgi:LAO/AO transport system kinase